MKGNNVEVVLKEGKAVFVVDLSKDFGPSSTGKSILIASAGGGIEGAGGGTVQSERVQKGRVRVR